MYTPTKKDIKVFYKPRIGNINGGLIIGYSAGIWGLQVLFSATGVGEVISEILGFIADWSLFVWLLFLGVYGGTDQGKKWLVTIAGSFVEIIPFINDVPADVAEVVTLIAFTRAEDWKRAKAKAIAAHEAQEQDRLARLQYIQNMKVRDAQIEEARRQDIADQRSYQPPSEEFVRQAKEEYAQDQAVVAEMNADLNDTRSENKQLEDYKQFV